MANAFGRKPSSFNEWSFGGCDCSLRSGLSGPLSSFIRRVQIAELPKKQTALTESDNYQSQSEDGYRRPSRGVPNGFFWLLIVAGPMSFLVAMGLAGLVYGKPGKNENNKDK